MCRMGVKSPNLDGLGPPRTFVGVAVYLGILILLPPLSRKT